jgi:hypothetical protein
LAPPVVDASPSGAASPKGLASGGGAQQALPVSSPAPPQSSAPDALRLRAGPQSAAGKFNSSSNYFGALAGDNSDDDSDNDDM